MNRRIRPVVAIAIAAVMLAFTAATVAAVVSETGTRYCSSNYTPYSRSYSTQDTEHFPPGSGYAFWDNGATWKVRKAYADSPGGGGWWGVYVYGGALDDAGTYSGCQLTGS
jgi:hypothetical protein